MKRYLQVILSLALVCISSVGFAQKGVVLFMDAPMPLNVHAAILQPNGSELPVPKGFFVQGQQSDFVVRNRKFLADYSVNVDGFTAIQNFPIEDLDEAANLTTPLSSTGSSTASKGAAPKGLATSGALSLRTAQEILTALMNPQTSASAASALDADWTVLSHEAYKVQADQEQFAAIWQRTLGDLPPPGSDRWANCKSAQNAPTLALGQSCLETLLRFVNTGSFAPAPSYTDEDEFRRLVVRDNDAIQMVQTLGTSLGQNTPQMNVSLTQFDSDLTQYRADLNIFASNMQAADDARRLLSTLETPRYQYSERLQIRAKLAQALNTGTQPQIDAAELNFLAGDYFFLAHSPNGQAVIARASIELGEQLGHLAAGLDGLTNGALGGRGLTPFGTYSRHAADLIATQYNALLLGATDDMNKDLPTTIQTINTLQSKVLARTNEIYDMSEVPKLLVKQFNISALSGNVVVYYTVRQVEAFPRFAVPPLAQQPTSASPAPPAPVPATTTTAPAPVDQNNTGNTSPGVVISHGSIEVHAFYKATMVAAFAFSGVGETTFSTSSITSGNASDMSACSPASPCTQIKVSRGADHTSVLLGLSYHFCGYDSFPGARQSWRNRLGAIGGLSVQNVNDYYGGFDFQADHGVQIMIGGNFYRQNQLSPNFTNGDTYPGTITSFTGPQHWTSGVFGGVGLNLSIFRKAFGSVTGVGAGSTKSAGS